VVWLPAGDYIVPALHTVRTGSGYFIGDMITREQTAERQSDGSGRHQLLVTAA
jgi:hypothetical protein